MWGANNSTTYFVECKFIAMYIFTIVYTDTYALHFLRQQEKSHELFVLPFFPPLAVLPPIQRELTKCFLGAFDEKCFKAAKFIVICALKAR